MNLQSTFKLNNGVEIPVLGLGTYLSPPGDETYKAVEYALNHGYRHIDTAAFYKNEKDVARGIKESNIPRNEVFITTKVWNEDQGYDKTMKAFDISLKNLDSDYVDLYLIHWPVPEKRKQTWKALETLYEEERARAVGVSNYTIRHLKELFNYANIKPVVNQVEFSPYLYQKELQDFGESNDILIEAYTPLTRGKKLKDPELIKIADRYKKSTAQILIKWAIQVNTIVLPKSVTKGRIIENADIFDFEISDDDLTLLNGFNENFRTSWDPTNEF